MKRLISALLCVIIVCALLTACGDQGEQMHMQLDPEQVATVTATDSLASSYLYVIEDKEAVRQLCELVNALTYRDLKEGEEAPDDLLLKSYELSFYEKEDEKNPASCLISPDGYFLLKDFAHPYVLTSHFDEERLKKLLEEYNAFDQ